MRADAHAAEWMTAWRRPRRRSMAKFAEDEIVVPTGPHPGPFKIDRQPYARIWFEQVDSGQWNEFVALGPSQSGKSLCCFVIPLLYYLFEYGETVIAAIPDREMIRDKWEETIVPVIERTRYRDWLPRTGGGSKGGVVLATRFLNGATLRWMTAGGRDKSRAHYTARIICFTETDGFDEVQEASDEGTKIAQIEARARAFSEATRRIFKECTVSAPNKHTWQRYTCGSSHSRIVMPCPNCSQFVLPEREHLRGHADATTEKEAATRTHFHCPMCDVAWTEGQRRDANRKSRIVHAGQSIDPAGHVTGTPPGTTCLGFRWTAVHNLLLPMSNLGKDEFRAPRAADAQMEERRMRQFVFTLPIETEVEQTKVDERVWRKRRAGLGRGQVPEDTLLTTVGVDAGKRLLHWTAIAWRPQQRGHVFDYGRQEVPSDDMEFGQAVRIALATLREKLGDGWTKSTIDRVHVDVRWETTNIVRAVKSLQDATWRPFEGLGGGGHFKSYYSHPSKIGTRIVWIGDGCHEKVRDDCGGFVLMQADANVWKTRVHEAMGTGFDELTGELVGSGLTLFQSTDDNEHTGFIKHLTAEYQKSVFEVGKGWRTQFVEQRSANHWLDSTYGAFVGAHRLGFSFGHAGAPASMPTYDSERQQGQPASIGWDGVNEWR